MQLLKLGIRILTLEQGVLLTLLLLVVVDEIGTLDWQIEVRYDMLLDSLHK